MGWDLKIDETAIPARGWSGPERLRSGYRGPRPSSREAGAVTFTLFGRPRTTERGSALAFDGIDDYAQVTDAAGLEMPAQMTIAAWVRQTGAIPTGGGRGIVMKGMAVNCSYGLLLFNFAGAVSVRFRQQSGSGMGESLATSAAAALGDGQWHLVIAQNDGMTAQIYIDNAASGSPDTTPLFTNCWNHGGPLTLGCSANPLSPYGRTEFCPVEIAQVLLLARPLTVAERASLWNAGLGSFDAAWARGRVNYGQFREPAILIDHSGTGLHGTVGGALVAPAPICLEPAHDVARRGAAVQIAKNGHTRLRGEISTVDTGSYDVRVTAMERAASLGQRDAGMPRIGRLPNPQLTVFMLDDEPFSISGEPASAVYRGTRVRPGHWQMRGIRPLQAVPVFDTWGYGEDAVTGDFQFRAMHWREEPIATLAARARELAAVQGSLLIRDSDLRLASAAATTISAVYTDDGKTVTLEALPWDQQFAYNLWGLSPRMIDGTACTYLWRVMNWRLEIFQLVNHGLAVYLGHIAIPTGGVGQQPGGGFGPVHYPWPERPTIPSFGPFAIPPNENFPFLLSFFRVSGQFRDGLYGVNADVYEIDLRQPRNQNDDEEIPHRVYRHVRGWGDPNDFAKFILCYGPARYTPTIAPQPLFQHRAERAGGRYEENGSGTIVWRGELWLTAAAVDFREATIADVLGELALCAGCEWWIDQAGTLRMERLDRAPRTVSATPRKILEDRTTDSPAAEFAEFNPQGVALTEMQRELLRRGLRDLAGKHQTRQRRIRYVPAADTELSLGARLLLNGDDLGRIVAIESSLHEETVELEPLTLTPERREL